MEGTLKGRLDWLGHRLTVEGSCSCGKYHHAEIFEPRLRHTYAHESVAVYACQACGAVLIVKAEGGAE